MAESQINELEDGWIQVKVPLPYALKWVNAYLLPEDEGWTLIDPGLRTPDAETIWAETLATLKISWHRIRRIVLTHHHPDHYGLAGWFQERSGAPVWMSDTARQTAAHLWGKEETFTGRMTSALREHGLPAELTAEMRHHLHNFHERVSPHPADIHELRAGCLFRMGGKDWEMIGGEGHAPGHISFYDGTAGKLLTGDQVLPDISPNIGWMPDADPDPLGSYLQSLHAMQGLKADRIYPGHREPFSDLRARLSELLAHHERRLDKILTWMGTETVTSFDVCEGLFGTRLRGQTHQLRFALAETIAHLIYLERHGKIVRSGGGHSTIKFRAE